MVAALSHHREKRLERSELLTSCVMTTEVPSTQFSMPNYQNNLGEKIRGVKMKFKPSPTHDMFSNFLSSPNFVIRKSLGMATSKMRLGLLRVSGLMFQA